MRLGRITILFTVLIYTNTCQTWFYGTFGRVLDLKLDIWEHDFFSVDDCNSSMLSSWQLRIWRRQLFLFSKREIRILHLRIYLKLKVKTLFYRPWLTFTLNDPFAGITTNWCNVFWYIDYIFRLKWKNWAVNNKKYAMGISHLL